MIKEKEKVLPSCASCEVDRPKKICISTEGIGSKGCPTLVGKETLAEAQREYEDPQIREFARQASIQEGECYANRHQRPYVMQPTKTRIVEIRKFARAAETARSAGFDFVEIHGAHGYLVCQFFSGADNRRRDEYGGDLEGRMRFGLALVSAMRQTVGEKFPILYRLGAEEKRPNGITLRQSRVFAARLQKAGVDAFDISIGLPKGRSASPGPKAKMGSFVHLAEAIKKEVQCPVMAVGRINRIDVAEEILTRGRADLVGIARQMVADPPWPQKVFEGRSEDIVPCTSCNTCFRPMLGIKWKPGDAICKVNPRAGKEGD